MGVVTKQMLPLRDALYKWGDNMVLRRYNVSATQKAFMQYALYPFRQAIHPPNVSVRTNSSYATRAEIRQPFLDLCSPYNNNSITVYTPNHVSDDRLYFNLPNAIMAAPPPYELIRPALPNDGKYYRLDPTIFTERLSFDDFPNGIRNDSDFAQVLEPWANIADVNLSTTCLYLSSYTHNASIFTAKSGLVAHGMPLATWEFTSNAINYEGKVWYTIVNAFEMLLGSSNNANSNTKMLPWFLNRGQLFGPYYFCAFIRTNSGFYPYFLPLRDKIPDILEICGWGSSGLGGTPQQPLPIQDDDFGRIITSGGNPSIPPVNPDPPDDKREPEGDIPDGDLPPGTSTPPVNGHIGGEKIDDHDTDYTPSTSTLSNAGLYVIQSSQMEAFLGALYTEELTDNLPLHSLFGGDNANAPQAVRFVRKSPFDLNLLDPEHLILSNLAIFGKDLPVQGYKIQQGFTNIIKNACRIHIPKIFDDYRDYSPYTSYTLTVPFCGNVTLPDICIDRDVTVDYIFDIGGNDAIAKVYIEQPGRRSLVDNLTGTFFAEYPFSFRNNNSSFINFVSNFSKDLAPEKHQSLSGSTASLHDSTTPMLEIVTYEWIENSAPKPETPNVTELHKYEQIKNVPAGKIVYGEIDVKTLNVPAYAKDQIKNLFVGGVIC